VTNINTKMAISLPLHIERASLSNDPVNQMTTFRGYLQILADSTTKDESKLKAAQELNDNFDVIIAHPAYQTFLDQAMRIFLKILQEGSAHFIAELHIQQVRKLVLEMIQRMPANDLLKPYAKNILSLTFKLLEFENEENVLVCLRIIIELHKQFRPSHTVEITHFLQFVKSIYNELPNHLNKIFEPRGAIKVKDLTELNIEALLCETFTITTIQTEKKTPDNTGSNISYSLIPKAVLSLKVLQELPIIVVLMYQLYKQFVHQEVAEFIPLIMNTISLQPAQQHRQSQGFNKEVFVDFMGAQIKTLSFLAYIIRIYQEVVTQHSSLMVKGMLSLLTVCPHEVAHLRKELLIAARHILATELRVKFVPLMEKLFDENILLGKGWTTYETLRPLAYSTLADLVHHVRQLLPLSDLSRAVQLSSKNVHDESLPTSIQTMSCKLLLNLVECIRQRSDQEGGNGRDLLVRMMEVFVLKFKTVAKLQLPVLMAKHRPPPPPTPASNPGVASIPHDRPPLTPGPHAPIPSPATPGQPATPATPDIKTEPLEMKPIPSPSPSVQGGSSQDKEATDQEKKVKFGFPASQATNYSVSDCRALVKTLVCGVKTITWGCTSCKPADTSHQFNKQFQPKETLIYIRLVKWAMEALDVYTLNTTPGAAARTQPQQTVRTKEEKEVLEHFAGVFALLNPITFKEVFSQTIDYVVERIYKNYALQIMANSFLANNMTSPIFATILVEYLLDRMHEMGSNMERSNLYLKLFKLVFGSVSLFAAENEQMLKPHLHQIVNKSMELALSAKEPYNYFLLLRALFRSIGGGSHDLLYQEFLPLLPNLLQGLNSLQSGLHKQHMKDLFVELCLTVPVRLSSLLPYLPMLMDPLVSALNGSQTLVSQGLRTLELCVDNLQPDFLYEHIQPVRAELMQALWRTLGNPSDQIAHVAFRVLGKFGGGNRKMMIEPQALEYIEQEDCGPALAINFPEHKQGISIPVKHIIETAFNALKSSTTEPGFYRKQCWEVIRCYLASSLQHEPEKQQTIKLLSHPSFREAKIHPTGSPHYQCPDTQTRAVHQMAVTGMFVAAAIKELRTAVLPTMVALVRHYTMVAIAQQAGPFPLVGGRQARMTNMDGLVLVDALASIMGHEEKELCKPGHLAMVLVLDTATNIMGSRERACRLPMMDYLAEKMCALCYERAWYAKLGGCIAIKFLFERMDLRWVLERQFSFLKALLFIMMDLTGEVSSGAVEMARSNLEKMLRHCAAVVDTNGLDMAVAADLTNVQEKSIYDVTHELVRQVTSPNKYVREQAIHCLKVLAELTNRSVTEVMAPHKDVLAEMIPPKKHLLRHQPINAQIGLMDGNTFCTTLEPRLFTIDLKVMEHKVFFTELLSLCEQDDATLQKLPCYKSVTNLVPLRQSALRALAACHYMPECRDKIFTVLYKSLQSTSAEIAETSFECMRSFIAGFQIDMDMVHQVMRQLLLNLGDYRNLNLNLIQRLSYLAQLFSNVFSEKLCEQLLQHLKKWLEVAIVTQKQAAVGGNKTGGQDQLKVAAAIVDLFHRIPTATARFIELLCKLVLTTERALAVEPGSVLRDPLRRYLARFSHETIDIFLQEQYAKEGQWSRYVEFLLQHKEGQVFRAALQSKTEKLVAMMTGATTSTNQLVQLGIQQAPATTPSERAEIQFWAVRFTYILAKKCDGWIATQDTLVDTVRNLWCNEAYHEKHKRGDNVDYTHWKEPKLVVKILLEYFKHNPEKHITLLFDMLRALCGRFLTDFEFLKDFLETEVSHKYSVEWKRAAFFEFVRVWKLDPAGNNVGSIEGGLSQDLRAKILQYILIPCFSWSFEHGEGDKLIGSPPAPDAENDDNVVSGFIINIIDPENPFGTSDTVRILLLQFSCLLVDQGAAHIHDAANKRQGNKLRRLMTYAWPCLLSKNCVDPATRYHGHLLLSHIIAKFAIHKRIVLQVFHSLLKAHAVEARSVVRQALEILTPSMPGRMEDGNTMLTHWTKKIIVEDGHTGSQLVHILQLVVKHHKVYYPVRHHLMQHIVTSIQRLGFTATATIEQKRLAVDLCEVAVKWEVQRVKDESGPDGGEEGQVDVGIKRTPSLDGMSDAKKPKLMVGVSVVKPTPETLKPIEKTQADSIVNYLLRLACQVSDSQATTGGSPGEILSRRCVALLKAALKPDIWPNVDLKLVSFDKILAGPQGVDSNQPNYVNICTCLELLTFLLSILRKDQILAAFKPLQKSIATCMNCPNSKVIRAVHGLMSRLMQQFPTEPTNSAVASKFEELEQLYAAVGKVIYEGLANYEKNATAPPSSLFGTLMMLKAACINNACYIDRLITSFMRVLQRMVREHLAPASPENSAAASELLILSLDLVKNRVAVMGSDMRKAFIGQLLVGLIEKSPDVKVMKAMVKMLEDWMKTKDAKLLNQGPSLKEKSILLAKMMQFVEKRFPDDQELNGQFLELVNFVYRDELMKGSELTSKLEPAFLAGLRCVQPQIRSKFFEVFDGSMRRRLHDRLLYIVCSQNWEAMGPHYWIKQCIELVLSAASPTCTLQNITGSSLLPPVTGVISFADPADRAAFNTMVNIKEEPSDVDGESERDGEGGEREGESDLGDLADLSSVGGPGSVGQMDVKREMGSKWAGGVAGLNTLVARQHKFLDSVKEIKTSVFLNAASQLCHMDTGLAEKLWLEIYIRVWSILNDKQREGLAVEIVPFICSGSHVVQKDCQPSALNTFVEGISLCQPSIAVPPPLLKYLGKSHNLWHRAALLLEQQAFDPAPRDVIRTKKETEDCYDFEPVAGPAPVAATPVQEAMDGLSELYSLLHEEDMWAGLWSKKAKYNETSIAISYEQQGFFEQAQGAYELAMSRYREDVTNKPAATAIMQEVKLWEDHWLRCSKELNQWETLLEYGSTAGINQPSLVVESAWKVPGQWGVMKDALAQLETASPREMSWKMNLYRGYLAICSPDDPHLAMVDRYVEHASSLAMREWRRLPRLVSHIHLQLLQAAQQVMELQEAAQIHQGLLHGRQNSLQDMKAIVKTWRNRLPVISDNLSHWSEIFTWRQHHYQFIANHYNQESDQASNHSMLGVHASAQAIIHFGKIARKQNLSSVCLDSLSKIYTIPSVPIVDCFQKIRQQVKCYVQMAVSMGKNELQEGLEVIESTNLKYFTREMTAEFYALKGMLLAQIGRSEDANKAFSAAVQMHDTLVKAWALWGDYLEHLFTRETAGRTIKYGVEAITCYLHACRHQNESKSRKYLAKVLWLLTYDDEQLQLAEAVDKYMIGVPPIQWLPWIPQLLTCLVRNEGKLILNLLSQVGRMFPQAVYFPIRTLYLTLKIEQRERFKAGELADRRSSSPGQAGETPAGPASDAGPIRATAPMWRCSRIMHMQRDLHPTILSSLEGIVDQMVWFRENWYEEVLRQLRAGLAKCYAISFDNRASVSEATITPHTLNFVKKLVSTFGIGVENFNSSVSGNYSSAANESLHRRAQATAQDPIFQKMKSQFTSDFDFNVPGAMKLQNLIQKLKKWIKILEAKTKLLPKSFLIEEKCRFLSNFSRSTAEVELPGEFLLPKHSHYYVVIQRFMPRVEICNKHGAAARRLYIRGHNGKIYPYLVVNDSGLADARREERVLQLLRMLNHLLAKHKETNRRFLNLTVARVVAVSPQMRLVEDNPSSLSLLAIYQQRCAKRQQDHHNPIARYYERLSAVQARGSQASHQVLRDILKEVQSTMVPRTMVREWATATFQSATDYWSFRKVVTLQLSLAGFAEYVLHLSRLNPDILYINQDSGLLNISYFKFDVDDVSGELDSNRPVPFRLTPNLTELVTGVGVSGPLTASMIAAARCLVHPSFKIQAFLRAILRDELIAWHKKNSEPSTASVSLDSNGQQQVDTKDGELMIQMVGKAVTSITARLQSLSQFDGTESKVGTLVAAACSTDNLCRMDPAWHPWL